VEDSDEGAIAKVSTTVAWILPEAVYNGNELRGRLDGHKHRLMGNEGSERRAGGLSLGGRRGISYRRHVNAAGADGEKGAPQDVDNQRLIGGGERRTRDRCKRAGLIVARGNGTCGGRH
jgi:hypothetical protein